MPAELRHLRFVTLDRLTWATSATVDVLRGDLATLRANGGFNGIGEISECLADNAIDAVEATASAVPASGATYFYLARSADHCNAKAGGSWGQVGEAATRDPGINGEAGACGE